MFQTCAQGTRVTTDKIKFKFLFLSSYMFAFHMFICDIALVMIPSSCYWRICSALTTLWPVPICWPRPGAATVSRR